MSPRGWATDDRSGFIGNHENLQWQMEWGGFKLYNKRILVYPDMYDKPQEQLRTIIIPPDPIPLMNARPENYTIEEETFRITQSGVQRFQMDGTPRVQSNLQGQPFLTTDDPLVLTSESGNWLTLGTQFVPLAAATPQLPPAPPIPPSPPPGPPPPPPSQTGQLDFSNPDNSGLISPFGI